MPKKKYYVVWLGHIPGIYNSWQECKQQIEGYQGAKYKAFSDKETAEQAFHSDYKDYIGKDIRKVKFENTNDPNIEKPVLDSISVDAACSGNPGTMEYRGVDTKTGAQLFHKGPYRVGTVNVGEFLALVHGLALLKQMNSTLPVYSDSKTAIKWVKDKRVNTKLARQEENKILFQMMDRAVSWLKNNTYPNDILKWNTALWGEIPADFGRK